jgi:hypothetical protein
MLRRYDDNSELRWMEGNGGPLLLVPGEYLPSWGGIDPPRDGRHIGAKFRSFRGRPVSDYNRACDVEERLGLLDIGAGQGLVLGGDDCGTTWLASTAAGDGDARGDAGGMLVRWVYGNGKLDAIATLERVPESAWRDDGLVLTVGHEPLYLSDAAYNLDDLHGDDHLTIHLARGRYAIVTAEYEPDAHISLILHRLTWIDR